jgi:hypothetical protein
LNQDSGNKPTVVLPPTGNGAATTRTRRRQNALFWIAITCLVLFGVPLLIYGAILAYVSFGFMNASVEQKLTKAFDSPAKIGSVKTHWLGNLRINDVAVQGRDTTPPLTVGSVALDWDLSALLQEQRIRTVSVIRPHVALRQDDGGQWNLSLKAPVTEEGGYRIEQIVMREGDFSVQWPGGPGQPPRQLRLQALSGTFADNGPLTPRSFSLFGVFDSLEKVSVTGSLGPGAAWQAHLEGAVQPQKDLANVLRFEWPAAGDGRPRIACDLSVRSENAAEGIAFSGQLAVENLRVPLTARRELDLPRKTLDLRGTVKSDASLENLRLSLDGVGHLSGAGVIATTPAPCLTLSGMAGTLDAEGVRALFKPRLFGEQLIAKGSVAVSNLSAALPLGSAATPGLSAQLASKEAHVSFHGLGELGWCDIAGTLDWPTLKDLDIKARNVGRARLTLANVYPPDDGRFWSSLVSGLTFHELNVDLAGFCGTELWRRIYTGNYDPNQPVAAVLDIPFAFKGTLQGKDIRAEKRDGNGRTFLVWKDLVFENLSVAKWPFPLELPVKDPRADRSDPKEFRAVLRELATEWKNDAVESIALKGDVTARAPDNTTALTLAFEHSLTAGESGALRPGNVSVPSAVIPVADLDHVLGLRKRTGAAATGLLHVREAVFDPTTGAASGTTELRKPAESETEPAVSFALSRGVQSAASTILRLTRFAFAAPALEKNVVERIEVTPAYSELKPGDVHTALQVTREGTRLSLKGKTGPLSISTPLPALGNVSLGTLPPADVALEWDMAAEPGTPAYIVTLGLSNGIKLHAEIAHGPVQPAGDAPSDPWRVTGTLDAPFAGGLALAFDVQFDVAQQQAGPLVLKAQDVDLAAVGRVLVKSELLPPDSQFALKGRARNVTLEVNRFPLGTVSAEKLANGRLTASLAGCGLTTAAAEVDRLTASVTCNLTAGSDGVAVNALVKADSYEALLGGGAFYIPPPPDGQRGLLKLVGKYTRRTGNSDITLAVCQFNLGNQVQADIVGSLFLTGDALTKIELPTLRIALPDMAQARRAFGPVNLESRAPWFGDVDLSGKGVFGGRLTWTAGQGVALDGEFGFEDATLMLGAQHSFVLRGIHGAVPVIVENGGLPAQQPAAAPHELRAKLKLGPLTYAGITAAPQEVEVVATPNVLTVASPYKLRTPAGDAVLERVGLHNLLTPNALAEIRFGLNARVEIDRVLRENGLAIAGIEGLTLNGPPLDCILVRTASLRGPWELTTKGRLNGPFYSGELSIENVNARGLFGPAPVFGGDVLLRGNEGIHVAQFTEKNQQWGKFAIRANAELRGLETTSTRLADVQAFTLDVRSVDYKENDFYYDGRLAMAVAPDLVRASFPRMLYSDADLRSDKMRDLRFGVRKLGLRFTLRDGFVYGPIPLLPDGLIVQAHGDPKAIAALITQRFKQDVKGDPDHKVPWAEITRKASRPPPK